MKSLGILAGVLLLAASGLPAQDLDVLHVQGNVYMIAGAGGNIAVQIGDLGVLVVDTGSGQITDKVLAAIRKLSDKPIQYIIDTGPHADYIGGSDTVRKAGVTITGANVTGDINDAAAGAQIVAHLNVLNRVSAPSGKQAPMPEGAWPTDTYTSGQKEVYFNGEPVTAIYQPKASTDGDSLVFFRRSDVLATGDIFVTTSYPWIDLENGGSIQGELDALNNILDITIPKHEEEGGTYVIPVTSSRTPSMEENSCTTPSIWTEVTAAPCSEERSTRRSALPRVTPKPRSRGSATRRILREGSEPASTCGFSGRISCCQFLSIIYVPQDRKGRPAKWAERLKK